MACVIIEAPAQRRSPLLSIDLGLVAFDLIDDAAIKCDEVWDVHPLKAVRVDVGNADAMLLGDRNASLNALVKETGLPGRVHVFLTTGERVELPLGLVRGLGADLALLEEVTGAL